MLYKLLWLKNRFINPQLRKPCDLEEPFNGPKKGTGVFMIPFSYQRFNCRYDLQKISQAEKRLIVHRYLCMFCMKVP